VKCEDTVKGTVESLPFKEGCFDGIIAKDVLEHFRYPQSVVSDFYRVSKNGKRIFISVPDLKSRTFWDDYTHLRPFTRKSIMHLLEDGGFHVDKIWYTSNISGIGILMRILKTKSN
jgi:ubiquinone/menaquinone biosynthesis C-methylase UbiE